MKATEGLGGLQATREGPLQPVRNQDADADAVVAEVMVDQVLAVAEVPLRESAHRSS